MFEVLIKPGSRKNVENIENGAQRFDVLDQSDRFVYGLPTFLRTAIDEVGAGHDAVGLG